MTTPRKVFKSYRFGLILLGSIAVGCAVGYVFRAPGPDKPAPLLTDVLKPLGDVFLNALFATVVPLVFFSIASAVAGMGSTARLLRILGWMLVVFVVTGLLAAVVMLSAVTLVPPAQGVHLDQVQGPQALPVPVSLGDKIVRTFTVPDFRDLLSKGNMLALILFAMLVGMAASAAWQKGAAFREFLRSGAEVFMKVIAFVMYYAPVGLGAYFAYLVGVFGPELVGAYARSMAVYYPVCLGYFFVAFSLYAMVGGAGGVGRFWKNIIPVSLTAAGTGSSYASIPANLQAADRIGTPREVSEVVIPIGATIHMDGSVLGAVMKMAFVFGLFGIDMSDAGTMATMAGASLLCGMVISGIPGGGVVGEVLIMALFPQLPPAALPIMNVIGNLIDPPATMVNAVGDNVAAMIVARIVGKPAAALAGEKVGSEEVRA